MMSVDGRILYRARQRLEDIRRRNEAELMSRRGEAYSRIPELRDLESQLRGTMAELINAAVSKGDINTVRLKNLALQDKLRRLLTGGGFPPDWLDMHYNCEKCSDTGYVGGKMCSCLAQLYKEEQAKELSLLLNLRDDTFDSFDLSYYDDTPDAVTGISPRTVMETIRDTCWTYSNRFGKNSANLYLTGGTGLGKTFLSTCIAKVVSEKGFSVVYDTAGSVFSKFEDEKFSKYDDMTQVRSDINRYTSCDLLILDDLGTEMKTAFTVSAFYSLVNSRLLSGKKTVISSNLDPSLLGKRYSVQISSRIIGNYEILRFAGRDIRILKKQRS